MKKDKKIVNNKKNISKNSKKDNIKLVLSFLILIFLIFNCSLLFYKFFNSKDPAIVSNLEVSLSNSKRSLSNEELNSDTTIPYTFNIINNGKVRAKYKVILYDNASSGNSIKRENLHYQLILNNSIIKEGILSDIKDDILDLRSINSNNANEYNLKVWIDEDALTEDLKYTYYLKVLPVED